MRLSLKHGLLLAASVCIMAMISQGCFAQTFSASISGVVTDPSGSMVPGAKIDLRNVNTNETRDAVSTSAGTYKFDNLLPGTYEITTEAGGFKTFRQSNMILPASTAATVNVSLSIGGTDQRVEVTAESGLVDTQSATNSTTFDSHLIESLPNSYRNPLNFVFALAGTTEGQAGLTTRSGASIRMAACSV